MGRFRALSAFLAVLAFAGAARAESVVYLGGTCVPDGTTTERTLAILQAELAPLNVARLDASPPDPRKSVVIIGVDECTTEPPGVRVTVWTNGAPRTRLVSLADAEPGSRDRTLALSLAEATRDLALPYLAPEPAPGPTASIPPSTTAPAPVPQPAPAESLPPRAADSQDPSLDSAHSRPRDRSGEGFRLHAGALVRVVASPATVLGGGEIGAVYRKATVAVRALGTERTVDIGTARLFAVVVAPGFDVAELFSWTRLRIGIEGGVVTASARAVAPAEPASKAAVHLAGSIGLATAIPLGSGLSLDGVFDVGYASSLTARADAREIAGLSGLYTTLCLGLRFPVE